MERREKFIISSSAIAATVWIIIFLYGIEAKANIALLITVISFALMFIAIIIVHIAKVRGDNNPILYKVASLLYFPIRGKVFDKESLQREFQTEPPKIDFYSGADEKGKQMQIILFSVSLTVFITIFIILTGVLLSS